MRNAKTMNILLLTNTMKQPDDEFKAKTDVVFSFARAWSAAGHNVVVIHNEVKFPLFFYKLPSFVYSILQKKGNVSIPSVKSRQRLKRTQDGVRINRIPMFKLIPHSRYYRFQYKKQLQLIKDFLQEIHFVPEIITGHWLEPQLYLVHELGAFFHAKTGFVFHGGIPKKLPSRQREMIHQLDCLFLRSQTIKQQIVDNDACKSFLPDRVRICFSGIPDHYLDNLHERDDWRKDGVFKIIYVGRLVRYKRVDSILKALASLSDKMPFHFDIVGEGTDKSLLRSMAEQLNILSEVTFHGMLERDVVQKMMRESECFVMISENEVFGLVYLEAMAAGCITVASEKGGMDGIIANNENGFLCEQANSDSLAKLLLHINGLSPDEIKRLRQNAYKTVQDYSDRKVAARYLDDIASN